MPVAIAPAPRMTVAQFLDWDDGTDTRYELVDGRPVAMNPPKLSHSDLSGALAVALGRRLVLPCRVSTEVGLRLPGRDDAYYQADLAVSCSERVAETEWLPDPIVIVEVSSPSTMAHDRGRKGYDYRAFPSLREIVFVAANAVRVDVLRRDGNRWLNEDYVGEGAVMRLESLDLAIPLAEIYRGIALEADTR